MARIEFGLWANEQAVFGSIFLMLASIVSAAGQFPRWEPAIAAGVLSILVLFIEYSRPGRDKKRVVPRSYQEYSTKFVQLLGRFGESYYIRFIILLLVAAPSAISLPTLLPAVCLVFSACTYLFAATRGEQWRPIQTGRAKRAKQYMPDQGKAPNKPPPRLQKLDF